MNKGLLWYDNDPKTGLAEKIGKAAAHYVQKFGRSPNLVHVNPTMEDCQVEGVTIVKDAYTLPNHLWMGVQDA